MVNFSNLNFPNNISFSSSITYPSVVSVLPEPITFHPDTLSWHDRATGSGGIVQDIDIAAIDSFVKSVYNLGLRNASGSNHTIVEVLPLAGNNLASCLTKLWSPASAPIVGNTNFTEADYSRSTGLKGNGTSKFLSSGLNLAAIGVTNSLALGVYNRTTGGFDAVEIGIELNFPDRLFLQVEYSDQVASLDCFNLSGGRCATNLSASDCTGFILGSRLSNTDCRFFRNGAQLASINTSGGTLPNGELFYYKANGTGYPTSSPRALGLIMVCRAGIAPNLVAPLNTLVQNLMTALGRAV